MYHYLFTNDLRISVLDESLKKAAECFLTNTVPSASEDKSANNNMKTLGFYFNLYEDSGCAKEAANGNIRAVVLNFIKKFQFPNLRTREAYEASVADGITLAPMRTIIKVLYCMNLLQSADSAFLTKEEISKFIFYNSDVAKTKHPNLGNLINNILEYRKNGIIPPTVEVNAGEESWKHGERQLREMIKVLVWSGCVTERDNRLYIDSDGLTRDNKADIYDIVNCNSFWNGGNLESYRNYMDMESDVDMEINNVDENPYKRAAKIIIDHKDSGYEFETTVEEYQDIISEINDRFSPEVLKNLSDEDLLPTMFYCQESNNDSLCYWLEFKNESKSLLGSISGGSAYKFGLFQRQENGVWTTGSSKKPIDLSEEQALELGKEIRNALVNGSTVIANSKLDNPEDYESLNDAIYNAMGKYASYVWVHKYFAIIYPDKFDTFHSEDWQKHVLYSLGIMPKDTYYARSGQISSIQKYTGYNSRQFAEIIYDKFGNVKKFLRIGTSTDEGNFSDELRKNNVVAIGWNDVGELSDYATGSKINRKALTEALSSKYYQDSPQVASRKAGEMIAFYESNIDTIFVPMDGERLVALADHVGEYYLDISKPLGHRKPSDWHNCFGENESLPNKSEGHLTTCYELTDPDNLLYLYQKYYYEEPHELEESEEEMSSDIPYIEPRYHTGIEIINPETEKPYAHNRIVFGAPGTGKSFKLDEEQQNLIEKGGEVERVTFHPDYSYAHFVGTYKPVPSATGISYEYVPGPFMRTYVNAIINGRSENPEDVRPYLLLIEEINRANVAAVFGEVFQLLDRDGENKSQYAVKPSEDIKAYLAKELGGKANDYKELVIPDNMYIWSTMNSADQGVFPMDTAFKRRWDFEYIGINHNDSKIDDAYLVCEKAGYKVNWNQLRKAINDTLSSNAFKINEDKLMGPFFVSKSVLDDAENFREVFKSKVIMYLFEDAAKQRRSLLFEGCDENTRTKYSSICEDFDKRGIEIFCKDVRDKVEIVRLNDDKSEGTDSE